MVRAMMIADPEIARSHGNTLTLTEDFYRSRLPKVGIFREQEVRLQFPQMMEMLITIYIRTREQNVQKTLS